MADSESPPMRIIAGKFKGRRLTPAAGEALRPTSDRVREAIFSALGSLRPLKGLRVLDLYAGTGALGFEALSRGAGHVWFVERDRRAVQAIQKAAIELGVKEEVTVCPGEVQAFLRSAEVLRRRWSLPSGACDLVLADPPYEEFNGAGLLAALRQSTVVHEDTIVVLEHRRGSSLQDQSERIAAESGAHFLQERSYGDTLVSYLVFRGIE